uniref:Integrase catalytic domain-containing protein n=1 Tax=Tanacetum cinerariifolium TaxID=118510 RepID=A0A699JXL8_TANCI|nr:hypothetical protein [Tanacetum cinerariifolium]
MTGAKFDIKKFDGNGDFGLWRIKMRGLLIQHGCEAALEVLHADMEAQTKAELNKKAYSAVNLCLALTLEDVMATLNSKEIKERSKAKRDDGEGLYVWGRTDRRDSRQSRDEQPSSSGSTYDDYEVMMVMSAHTHALLDLIMDLGCSYHMTHRKRQSYAGLTQKTMTYQRGGTIGDGKAGAVWQEKSRFKHEAFGKFKEWNQLAENQTGRTVKKLRTDNGLEFCNREFEQLCIESGIDRHLIVVGTPQQNGVAERMNRILMDKMWSGHRSDYGMLRIFGCVAYPHDKQGKLELRAVKCVLLGYLEGVKGYILYRLDDESPKIVTSMNVDFNESVMYKDTLKDSDADDKFVKELLVEVELQRLNNHTSEEGQTDQEDGDDEDAWDQATDQPPDLTDYQLVWDREPRTRTKPLRFRDESNMAA